MNEITSYEDGWKHIPCPTPENSISNLKLIPVPLPPALLPAFNIEAEIRYICLTYQYTNCYVETALGGHTDSYWIYRALVEHFTIAIHLLGHDLGSDDTYPTSGLLIDQEQSKMWVGNYKAIKKFLTAWQNYSYPEPPLTPEIRKKFWDAVIAGVNEVATELRTKQLDCKTWGSQQLKQQTQTVAAMTGFLNQHINESLALILTMQETLQQQGKLAQLARLNGLLNNLINQLENNETIN